MARRFLSMASATAVVVLSFLLGSVFTMYQPGSKTARKVAEVYERIRAHYPGEIPHEKLERAAIAGLLSTTDKWSEYFTAAEWQQWSQQVMLGKFPGVGIRVEPDDKSGYLMVTSPIEDTPAFHAGLLPGDLIVKVDGVDVKGQPGNEVISRIRGEVGTKLVLTLRRGDLEPFDVTLTRAEIKIVAVKHRLVEPGIGYIRINDFTEEVPVDFEKAYRDLEGRGMNALVIDLRFNGGGLLKAAVELCDLWLPPNAVVVTSEGKRPEHRTIYKAKTPEALGTQTPVAILVNRDSASASEIVAGALRDHHIASLVGTRTFGKGLVQSQYELSDGSYVKLTTARWVTPNGEQVGAKDPESEGGLVPTYFVEMTPDEELAVRKRWFAEGIVKGPPIAEPPPKDFVLEAGLEVLRAKREGRPPKVERREIPKPEPKEPK